MTAERGNSKGRRTIGGLIQSDWPRRNRGLESEVLQGSSNPEGRQQPTCMPGRKGSFAGIFEPTAWQQPTCTPREKHEAMYGTGDMARNPRINGDAVTPKQKVGGQKRGTSLSVTYYRDA